VSIERGYDPRRFYIYAFGGAGPAHAAAYGAGLGARGVVVPAAASEFSAFGIATSDLLAVAEMSEVHNAPLDMARLKEIYAELEARTGRELVANGVTTDGVGFERFMRMRYRGQVNELLTPIPPFDDSDAPIIDAFDRLYAARFGAGAGYRQAGIQALTYMVHARGTITHASIEPEPAEGPEPGAVADAGRRQVVFAEQGRVDTRVYRSDGLRHGNHLPGPAIVEAPTTTVVIPPGYAASVDAYRNIVVTSSP
jgi:N-methylhydantoinase A